MDYKSYVEYLNNTIRKYSKKQLRFILRQMIKAEIAYSGQIPIQLSSDKVIDITDMNYEVALLKIIKESEKVLKSLNIGR